MNDRLYRSAAMLLCAAAISGCGHEGAAIQKQYSSDHDECRSYAEEITHTTAGSSVPSGHEQILLVAHFARCMNKRGWDVNKPPADVTAEAMKSLNVRQQRR